MSKKRPSPRGRSVHPEIARHTQHLEGADLLPSGVARGVGKVAVRAASRADYIRKTANAIRHGLSRGREAGGRVVSIGPDDSPQLIKLIPGFPAVSGTIKPKLGSLRRAPKGKAPSRN